MLEMVTGKQWLPYRFGGSVHSEEQRNSAMNQGPEVEGAD